MSEHTVFVANCGVDVGSALARGLATRGATVERIGGSFASRAAVEQAFAEAASRAGPPDQVVVSALPEAALQPCPIHEMTSSQWRACSEAMKALLYTLQAAFTHMGERGGSVVAIGPSLSLAGAPCLVALSAAVEGQRGLVKSTARQWGRRGLTVNWVAAAPRALSPLFNDLPLPVKPDAVMVALGRGPSLDEGLAGVVDFLGSPAGRALTGTTLMADGGEWMVP